MNVHRGAAMAIAIVVTAAGVGACSDDSEGSTDLTITYWENLIDDGGVQDQVIAEFEESHPGVTVNRVTMQLDDLSVKLPSALGTKSGPDLVYGDVSPQLLGEFVRSGRILELDEASADRGWEETVYPWAQERARYNGHKYAVGHEVEDLGLMYNKLILDDLGIAPPTSFDELEEAMATIGSETDVTPMTLACGGGCYNGFHVMHDIAYATIPTSTIISTTPQGDGAYTDDGWLEALTTFQDWADKGYFTDGANGIDFENHWADFCAGKAAMLTQGTWLFKTIDDCAAASDGALDWANIPFPVRDGMPFQAYVGIGSGWYLPGSIEDDPTRMEAVLDLVEAFTTPAAANEWVSKAQIFPAVPFDETKVDLTAAQKGALSIIQQAGDNGGAVPVGFNNSSEESEIWAAGLQGIVDGSMTPEELIEQLQSQLEESQSDWSS